MSDDLILHFDDKIVKLTISNDLDELDAQHFFNHLRI